MKNLYPTLFALSCLLIISCRKDGKIIQPNVKTTISGQFYDAINDEPYANVKLKIGEYKRHSSFYGDYYYNFVGYRDSTLTDTGGAYKINFTTSGNGSSYFLEFLAVPNNVFVQQRGIPTTDQQYYRSKLIEKVGISLNYDFDVIKYYFMKTRIVVHDNPYAVLSCGIGNDKKSVGPTIITGKNADTVVNIPILKNSNGFRFYVSVTDPVTHVTYTAPKILLNPVIDRDTIPGGTYEFYPATFQ